MARRLLWDRVMSNPWWPRRVQGVYYIATGLWPVVDIDGYMAATGQESHGWVAQVLGGAVAVVGVALALGVLPPRVARGVGLGTALVLGGGGAWFAAHGHGVPVNAGDAAAQAAFALSWALARR